MPNHPEIERILTKQGKRSERGKGRKKRKLSQRNREVEQRNQFEEVLESITQW